MITNICIGYPLKKVKFVGGINVPNADTESIPAMFHIAMDVVIVTVETALYNDCKPKEETYYGTNY